MRSEPSTVDGLLDTNIVIHSLTNDVHSAECRRFISQIASGTTLVWLEPLVLHELSYAVSRYLKQLTRNDIAQLLITVLSWTGVRGDIDAMREAVETWRHHPNLAFVDAYLPVKAIGQRLPVVTKNATELSALGVDVPDPLPEPRT